MAVNILEGNCVTDFVNNTAKTCSYGLEISGIIETNISFQNIFSYMWRISCRLDNCLPKDQKK